VASQVLVLVLWSLALVLLVSGSLKLRHTAETLRSLDELRLPRALRRLWVARSLPVAELAVGLGLLAAPAPVFTVVALGASLLFAVFFGLTLAVVARGENVVCACFGVQSQRPIDSLSVVRNGLLLAGAVAVTVGAREGAVLWMLDFGLADWTVFFAAAATLLAIAAVVLWVGRSGAAHFRGAEASAAASGARPGAPQPHTGGELWPVPDLEVTEASGRAVELVSIARDRPVLLVLLSAQCTPCGVVADRMPEWQRRFGEAVEIAVLTSESPEDFSARYPRHPAKMYYGYRSLMAVTGIAGVPSALLLGTDRMVAAGPAQGLDDVIGLADAIASVLPQPGPQATSSVSHRG
jgi:hypothetical protein